MNRFAAAFVVGRRDYTATVFSRAFLFFLLGPLFPILLGVMFGGIGASVAREAEEVRVAVLASERDFGAYASARDELQALPGVASLPLLVRAEPASDPKALLSDPDSRIAAVLSDPAGRPHLTGSLSQRDPLYGEVKLILNWAQQGTVPLRQVEVTTLARTSGSVETTRTLTARLGQGLLFLLTLLLAGMLLSQFIEEKSNKVIEVLAAAVPVESIFLGKLFAMLAMSLTGIAVWACAAIVAIAFVAPPGALAAIPAPAVGWLPFVLLGAAYFAMSYLLIGGAFLAIGAQASTVREVQTLSMPVTMAQVLLFALASYAISDPDGTGALVAAIFPLSSPFAMIAKAAVEPSIWPHLLALGWQALWISLILKGAAAWFRRAVLSSGGTGPSLWKRVRGATA